MTFPCPHTRELTDRELDQIAAVGAFEYEDAKQRRDKQREEPLPGDEWKDAQ